MNEQQNAQSGTNTILIVMLIVIVLGIAIWFFGDFGGAKNEEQNSNEGLNIELNLPGGTGSADTGTDTSGAQQ